MNEIYIWRILEGQWISVDNISTIRGVGVVDISGWLVTFLTSNLAIANLILQPYQSPQTAAIPSLTSVIS